MEQLAQAASSHRHSSSHVTPTVPVLGWMLLLVAPQPQAQVSALVSHPRAQTVALTMQLHVMTHVKYILGLARPRINLGN